MSEKESAGSTSPPPIAIHTQPVSVLPLYPSLNPSSTSTPGLQGFAKLNNILVKEVLLHCMTVKRTVILDGGEGLTQLFAAEEDICPMELCGRGNSCQFRLAIKSLDGMEVIHLIRGGNPCCPALQQSVTVQSPPGQVLGSVEQEFNFWGQSYVIKDPSGEIILRIQGPGLDFNFSCLSDIHFRIFSGELEVGKICKTWKWRGCWGRNVFKNGDSYEISIPAETDVRVKVLVLGALFLIRQQN